MATVVDRWIKSGSPGAWNTGAHWSTGAKPGAGEIALCDGTGQADILGSDQGADSPILKLLTHKKYRGEVGSLGTPLEHNVLSETDTTARVVKRGSGGFYFNSATGAGLQACNYVIDGPGTVVLNGGTPTNGGVGFLFVGQGAVTVAATCRVASGVYAYGEKANVTIAAAGSTETNPPVVHVERGLITNHRISSVSGNLLSVVAGRLLQLGLVSDNVQIIAGRMGRGIFDYQPNAALTGSHNPDVEVGGVLDLSNSNEAVQFGKRIIGVFGRIVGAPIQSGSAGEQDIDIDLREEYP